MQNSVYIFDVDGVLNNITDYVADLAVIDQISQLLNEGFFVAINTGRGYNWVEDNIIEHIKTVVQSEMLQNLYVSTEMGGVTIEFAEGEEKPTTTMFSIQPEQISIVKKIFDEEANKTLASWYQGKVSMATIAKPADVDGAAFNSEASRLGQIIQQRFENEHIKVVVNPDAIDVTTPEAGKWAGAQLIYDWLTRAQADRAEHYVCFGDNRSDYDMARFYAHKGHEVEFVFTGKSLGVIQEETGVNIINFEGQYNEGTKEYLKKVLNEA